MTTTKNTDIVERLRNDDVVWGTRPSLAFEAADEIEKLREALRRCVDWENNSESFDDVMRNARAALKEGE